MKVNTDALFKGDVTLAGIDQTEGESMCLVRDSTGKVKEQPVGAVADDLWITLDSLDDGENAFTPNLNLDPDFAYSIRVTVQCARGPSKMSAQVIADMSVYCYLDGASIKHATEGLRIISRTGFYMDGASVVPLEDDRIKVELRRQHTIISIRVTNLSSVNRVSVRYKIEITKHIYDRL